MFRMHFERIGSSDCGSDGDVRRWVEPMYDFEQVYQRSRLDKLEGLYSEPLNQ